MNKKVLVVEDQFVEAHDLQLMLEKAGYEVCGIARSVIIAQEIIKKEKPGLVLLDIFLKGKLTGIDLAIQLRDENIAFIFLSANSNEEILAAAKTTEPLGFIVKPFREKDLLVTLEIAQYRHEHSRESKYRREAELLLQLEKSITENSAWTQKLLQIGKILQLDIPFDFMSAGFSNPERTGYNETNFLRIGFDEYQTIGINELLTIARISMPEFLSIHAATGNRSAVGFFNNDSFEKCTQKPSLQKLFWNVFDVNSCLSLPLQLASGELFSFCFYSRRPDVYTTEHISLFHRLEKSLASNIEQQMMADNSVNSSVRMDSTKALTTNINKTEDATVFEGIIGNSHQLLKIFDLISQVAPSDTSVLILGESGTGKERIADCIHQLSPRNNKPFIKVNCATLPPTLIESELFGHEKGAFTGAMDKRIGKFEKADKGTIFLDEIGEMPADLQVKLLRVLQEKYIERIGSKDITKVDVRVIAATNRKLEKEVAEGRFRLDLYYRLNVFPMELPALRERSADIPILAQHFIKYYNRKSGKKIVGISDKILKNMIGYDWPGNIRELENLIERAVLLTKGTTIEEMLLPVINKSHVPLSNPNFPMKTIHENERDYIMAVLKTCNGRIWGEGGAAEILNIPPTTLKSKMKKLDIRKDFF